jgi:hypothetical protein
MEPKIEMVFESDTLTIYRVEDEEGEVFFDVHLFDSITLHFMKEEWNEFVEAIHSLDTED